MTETTGNPGNRGNTPAKAAEISHSDDLDGVAPTELPRGNRGNTAPDRPEWDGEADVAGADPFARLTDADRVRASAIPAGGAEAGDCDDILEPCPCPEKNPPPQRFRHWSHGEPSGVWMYRAADCAVLMVTARYDFIAADGSPQKDVLPWTYGRRVWTARRSQTRDVTGWHCKAPPAPRPLYGLDRLAARPDALVLICEGEKAADAASVIFPDLVCITSQGGSKAPGKSDFSPCHGRRALIWPDHDEPGATYAAKVADLATAAGAVSVQTVEVPDDWPPGWDLADELPGGIPPGRLGEMLEDAPDGAVPEMPERFRMTAKSLFFDPPETEKNPDPAPVFVASKFRVVGATRSDSGEAWGLCLRWRDREGRPHQWAIPRRMIHRPGNEIAEELEHAGLSCGSDARAHDLLKRFIGGVRTDRLLRCVTRTGWHHGEAGPVFVLPGGEAYGRGAADLILQTEYVGTADAAYRPAGTLADWRCDVAAPAQRNDRIALCLSAAFTGPLLDIMAEPSGGLHLVGDSRTGKSTAAVVAASVWGKPTAEAQLRAWRGTANGLEGTAAETTDTLLILDEMGQADAREVGDVVNMLANEAGKQRASRAGSARRRQSWRVLFLSTGEITLAQKMGEIGKRAMAGLEVRLVNVPADAGAGLGVFQNLDGRTDAAALADQLRGAARMHYGTAGRAFLARLVQDRAGQPAELRDTLAALRDRFLTDHVPEGATGQVRSVAGRFALIGAAGELARDYGVLPWAAGEALRAAGACFAAWLAARGGAGPAEDAAALAQVRQFIETHGESRFTPLTISADGGEATATELFRTINRAGWRRRSDGERWEYLVLPETWKNEVCKGLDAKRTADLLAGRGFLTGGDTRHRAATVRVKGEGTPRVYQISGAILGEDAEAGSNGVS